MTIPLNPAIKGATITKNEIATKTKISHISERFESEKDLTPTKNTTYMALAIIQSSTGLWKEVKKKKGKVDDFYNYTSR